MKKLLFLQLTVFVCSVFIPNTNYGQTASDWNAMYNNAKRALSTFPSVDKINNSKLPLKSKQWLLDTRTTLTAITRNKTAPSQKTTRQLFSKVGSLPQSFRENVVVMLQDDGSGSGPGTSKHCENVYNKCMEVHNCTYSVLCLCCQPCVWEYIGCMKDIVFIASRTDIKTKPPGAATRHK